MRLPSQRNGAHRLPAGPPAPKERLSIRIPAELLERLQALAKAERRSVSSVTVALLEASVERAKKR
ncbi:MAG: ribbon-helix-helix domain-containing protein [Myxococcaceae bacterium]